jgi:hypothetical protein
VSEKSLNLLVELDGIEPTTSSMPLSRLLDYASFSCFLDVAKCMNMCDFTVTLIFSRFPLFPFWWRHGGDMEFLPDAQALKTHD